MVTVTKGIKFTCGPPPSNSDHQDDITFSVGNPNLNLHLPLLLGWGSPQAKINSSQDLEITSSSHFCHAHSRPYWPMDHQVLPTTVQVLEACRAKMLATNSLP